MSAVILTFPRRKPMEWDELPLAWTDGARSLYRYLTYDGEMTHAEAMDYVESTQESDRRTQGDARGQNGGRRG